MFTSVWTLWCYNDIFINWKVSISSYLIKLTKSYEITLEFIHTHVTQARIRHPEHPAMKLQLTCDQIHTRSESLHVKYCAKEKKRNGNSWEQCRHVWLLASNQHWTFDIFYVLWLIPLQKVELGKWIFNASPMYSENRFLPNLIA